MRVAVKKMMIVMKKMGIHLRLQILINMMIILKNLLTYLLAKKVSLSYMTIIIKKNKKRTNQAKSMEIIC